MRQSKDEFIKDGNLPAFCIPCSIFLLVLILYDRARFDGESIARV